MHDSALLGGVLVTSQQSFTEGMAYKSEPQRRGFRRTFSLDKLFYLVQGVFGGLSI